MKPHQREAELRRKVARMARRIPDAFAMRRILETITGAEPRRRFLNSVRPYLRFQFKENADG